jgi:peptidoglycan hydrolase-like protein with peptidoglycan-binding domain
MTLISGMSGTAVGALHQLLLEANETVNADELRSQTFGPSTKTAVLDFQSSHVDPQGRPLAQDGIVGPVTYAALQNPRSPVESFTAAGWRYDLNECRQQERIVVEHAVSSIGTKEDPPGSNRGPKVDLYNGPDYLGSPWCANWVSYMWRYADGGSPFGKLASAFKFKAWGEEKGRILASDVPARPGDIGVIMRAQGRGHVVLVVGGELPGEPTRCIEGNCGNAVRATLRDRSVLTCIVRPLT